MSDAEEYKIKSVSTDDKQSAFQKYRDLCYGDISTVKVIRNELIVTLFGWIPGALGLFLRSKLYPFMFKDPGHKPVFGRNVTIRHAHKIELGDGVIVDDLVVLDAKGSSNHGIEIGDGVYIGRHTIIYTKNGDIKIEDRVNISSNCQIFSSNNLVVGHDTIIGAFTYLLSGGEYDYTDPTPFSKQSGMNTRGPTHIGPNCWLSARVTVLDGVNIGEHCVLGAGAVVTGSIPAQQVAVGVPARVCKTIALPGVPES